MALAPILRLRAGVRLASLLLLWIDRLAALEHRNEALDLLLPPGFGLHIVNAEGEREAILCAECREHCFGLGLGVDGGLEIIGDLHVLAAIGARPASVGLGRLDFREPVPGHPAFLDEPGDIVDIDLAPDALPAARRITLQIAPVVKALANGIDPAPAEADIDGFLGRDRLAS